MKETNQKKERSKVVNFLVRLMQIIIFIPIQIVFIPITIIGFLYGMYIEMYRSKKLGVSFSAGQSLQYRWIMHTFDTRPDPLSVKFTKKFACESHFALWTTMGAFIICHKLFGFKSKFNTLVEPGKETLDATAGIRVLRFDAIMDKYVDEMDQIVLPGAGFDLIAQKYTKGKNIKVFELDQINTINLKVKTLDKARIEHDWIKYIPVDYEKESWAEKLVEAGFDKTKKTLFLWQSVSLYLEEDQVRESLKQMSELSSEGSIVAQDFYSLAFMEGRISKIAKTQMDMIGKLGEPWKFALEMSDNPEEVVGNFLDECGLTKTDFYLFGTKLDIEPFYCIVEAKKKN